MSYVRIGEMFSGRDHSTVMHAVEKIQKKTQTDQQLLREIHALESELGIRK
jgi:chromosomal replication initiator protein